MKTVSAKTTRSKAGAWLRAARPQFYPMAWIAYTLGTVCAVKIHGVFYIRPYLAGYLCLFLLELLTVLLNDYFDYNTDRLNRNASFYSGGSRTLVEHHLSFREVKASTCP
jgi:1,4-dihydroxy-2-naphthoate octaprenyltransferase